MPECPDGFRDYAGRSCGLHTGFGRDALSNGPKPAAVNSVSSFYYPDNATGGAGVTPIADRPETEFMVPGTNRWQSFALPGGPARPHGAWHADATDSRVWHGSATGVVPSIPASAWHASTGSISAGAWHRWTTGTIRHIIGRGR